MSPRRAELRVGSVPYLVGRPLDLGLEAEPGIRYERRVPARLVEGLRSGEIDVALVSSIELFRRPGYRWIEGVGVAGNGPVGSVQVFLRRPIEDIASLALDPDSRAAAALVRVLFARALGGSARGLPRAAVDVRETPAGVDPRAHEADAWLRIGDRALAETLAPDAPPVFNPSAEWCARTGLPFVFAAWIVRPGIELGAHELEAFARSRARGERARTGLADAWSASSGLPLEACRHYLLRECLYEPGEAMARALFRFRDAAAALGIASGDLTPESVALHPVP